MTTIGSRSWSSKARLLLLAGASVPLAACMGSSADIPADRPSPVVTGEDLPVIQLIHGEYDGQEFTFRTLQPSELGGGLDESSDELGVTEAPLVDIPSMSCVTCTGASYVAFSNAAGGKRAITNGAAVSGITMWGGADVGNCGAAPTTGVCQQVRMRNLYPQQLERVYAELMSITPTGSTTAASVPTQPFGGVPDFGLNPPAVANGLWRAGEIGRSSPAGSAGGGVLTWWAFNGETAPATTFTFSFLVQVRGLVVTPTRRASLADGALDAPASDYPARTAVGATNTPVTVSENGQYVAFASAGPTIYRKDLTSGGLVRVVNVPCTSATNAHLSADGSVVVFQAHGCDLTGEGSNATSPQIFAHDFNLGETTLITRSTTGGYANGTSQFARVSGDGSVVVFQSGANNLVDGTPVRGGCTEVYRFDRLLGTMVHASTTRFADVFDPSAGWLAGCGGSAPAGQEPDVSGDGNTVVFTSALPLDPADTNGLRDIYVYDHAATDGSGVAIVHRVSVSRSSAQLASLSLSPTVSADGLYVAFLSDATNVVTGETTSGRQVYRRSSAEGADSTIDRVSRRVDDGVPAATTGIPTLSGTGRFVAFWSAATSMASTGPFNPAGTQVYVCDTEAPVAALQRCWVASTLQPTAASPFAVLSASVSAAVRISLAYPSDIDAGYVAYVAAPTAGTWGTVGGAGLQAFVSPVGDPRYQQAVVAP